MKFSYLESEKIIVGKLLYIKNEYSLTYEPFSENVNFSIMCGGYVSLDTVLETDSIVHISGFSPKKMWIQKEINMPISRKGVLKVHFKTKQIKGTGVDLDRSWQTYYDKNKKLIYIGDGVISKNDECIEFAKDVFVILRGSNLIAVLGIVKES